MRVIPVLDVIGGLAVHAQGGRRDDYRPIGSTLRRGSDPVDLAHAVRDCLGLGSLYLADLDAILGKPPALVLYRELATLGLETWVDAGLCDGSGVASILDAGVVRVVAGLETVAGPSALREILDAAGPDRVVFSLDLRDGRPILAMGSNWGGDDPRQIAEVAVGLGVTTVILLDLGRVGSSGGVGTIPLLDALRREFPQVAWVVGGGVSSPLDLDRLAETGASAVLVASAIHDGRIGPDDLAIWLK